MYIRQVFTLAALFFLTGVTVASGPARRIAERANSGGRVVGGLRISLIAIQASNVFSGHPAFRVEVRNDSDQDLVLDLGMMLANGRKQYPDAISLILTSPSGTLQHWLLAGPALVAGRIDPMVVPLPVGATFSISVDLTRYAPFGEAARRLVPGKYSLQAEFEGNPATDPNLDMRGISIMPYWAGTVVSNRLQFEIGGR